MFKYNKIRKFLKALFQKYISSAVQGMAMNKKGFGTVQV
jgi:hypothetical protein